MAAYSTQEWADFIKSHGGLKGAEPVKSDATIPDPDFPNNPKLATANPYQAVKYTFSDGTYITVRPDPGVANEDGSPPEAGFNVVNGGTALKGAKAAAAPKTVRDPNTGIIYSVNPDGTLTAQTDPSQKPVTPKDTVPGTGTTATPGTLDQNGDPIGATPGTPDLPVDVYGAQTARQNAENTAKNDAAARSISQQNADTSAANSAEAAKQNAIGNARQAAQDTWQRTQADIANGLAANRYSLDQAQFLANEAHQKISEDLQRSEQAIQQRGQDLSYLGNQSYVTKGQYESLQGAEGQLAQTGGVAFTPSPTPPGLGYDPAQLAASLAQQALGQTQQANQPFSLGQAPAAPAGPGFVAPSFEQGGIQTNNPGTPPLAVAARR